MENGNTCKDDKRVSGRFAFLLAGMLMWLGAGVQAGPLDTLRREVKESFVFESVSAEDMDVALLTRYGTLALTMPSMKWKHAETEHFVIHYERKTFARHVARLAEFFYAYIGVDLEVESDRLEGRSHIFIFRDDDQWRNFLIRCDTGQGWMVSFVNGPGLFLQRIGSKHDSSGILAHEMTHLIINRYFGQPPLWLNEGLAEWYREFGYSAFKGVKKSKKSPFNAMKKWIPLGELIRMDDYPHDLEDLELFYKSAKYLTGFLLLKYPPSNMNEFIRMLVEDDDVDTALNNVYRIAEPVYLEKKFRRFAR